MPGWREGRKEGEEGTDGRRKGRREGRKDGGGRREGGREGHIQRRGRARIYHKYGKFVRLLLTLKNGVIKCVVRLSKCESWLVQTHRPSMFFM